MEKDSRLVAFKKLLDIMDKLRAECPWDQKQTFESLRHLTIEETYELADAILEKQYDNIAKELGDIMLHIVFYSKIGEEKGFFDIETVLNEINKKLIRRHPHVFGDIKIESTEDVKKNWEVIKLKEENRSVLGGVPTSLPALVKAYRIQDKARGIGFDWENKEQVWNKVEEELNEFKEEVIADSEKKEEEFGDLLFSLINYARFLNINPENALEKTNKKFISRFKIMEKNASDSNHTLSNLTLTEMELLWQEAKKYE